MTQRTSQLGDKDGKRSRAPIYIVGAVAVIVALIVAACIAIASSISRIGDISIGSKHLTPIPVPASACPYLREVHNKADAAGHTYLQVLTGQTDPRGWRTQAAEHAQQLAAFELTLRAAIPHVPRPVANELHTVVVKVVAGRKEVAGARSSGEYMSASANQVFEGTAALGNASDLVGDACGFTLNPNVSGP